MFDDNEAVEFLDRQTTVDELSLFAAITTDDELVEADEREADEEEEEEDKGDAEEAAELEADEDEDEAGEVDEFGDRSSANEVARVDESAGPVLLLLLLVLEFNGVDSIVVLVVDEPTLSFRFRVSILTEAGESLLLLIRWCCCQQLSSSCVAGARQLKLTDDEFVGSTEVSAYDA